MVTEGPVKMASAGDDLEVDIDALLREHQHQHQQQPLRELGVPRSGSAPPTVEGSMAALRSMLGGAIDINVGREEGDVRADPAYLAYYYSNENTNPRLPPPVLSREDWRATQRLRSFGGIGDQRKKAVAVAPGASAIVSEEEGQEAFDHGLQARHESPVANWGNDGLTGLPGMGLGPMGARKKSFADVLQNDLVRSTAAVGHSSPPVSRNPFNGTLDQVGMLDCQLIKPQTAIESAGNHSSLASTGLNGVHSIGSSLSPPLSSGRNATLFRSRTSDPKLIQRIPSPGLPPISTRSTLSSDIPSGLIDHGDIAATFSGIDLSNTRYSSAEVCGDELAESNNFLVNLPHEQNHYLVQNTNNPEMQPINIHCLPMEAYSDLLKKNVFFDSNAPKLSSNGHAKLQRNLSSGGISSKISTLGSSGVEGSGRSFNKTELSNPTFAGSNLVGFLPNQASQERLPNHLSSGNGLEGQYLNRSASQDGSRLQSPLYAQYLQRANLAAQASSILNEPLAGRNLAESSLMDINGYQKAYFEALAAQQKLQHGLPFLGNSISLDRSSYVSSAYGLGLPYSAGHVSSSLLSTISTGNSLRQPERLSRFPSTGRTSTGVNLGSWMPENGIKEVGLSSSFLEEFKTSKTKNYELSDILNHVVEFSADQYGSRFIQQKLESAPVDEKNLIFPEILPHARALMTDVFGNYVIQKFFEHGTEAQRMQLASQLKGHVLPLSLQMYGCRVIQKALEVVDVDQQTEMVSELDGSVMKCVRDQNGNHVIQKCIECVPQEKVQFIISTFYGQVVTLSMHPYGCRVIQRVLENCNDSKTLNIMMDEILKSISSLAQDQYGNYVVQHVLQHGKPEERSAIISTLAGQIVKMSQQKFASNVVEKCLTYGTAEERQILINEMLGATDENEPLQAMMKDQFGNYVVQKVLETCDDQNREFILSRIKVHLNALKRYTYGKHIVARVEKLVAAGERHVATMSPCS